MIELQYVEKWYTRQRMALYLDKLSFADGEIVGILGENGSGKTTLLKAIMGLGELQNGQVRIDGKPPEEMYSRMAYITEEGSYLPHYTPDHYAEFLAGFYPAFDYGRFERLLQFYQLERDRRIRTFSKGQKAKLEICAGLSKGARYLLMDEPFLGKDLFSRQDFLKLMVAGMQGDEIILIATHFIEEIENVIDRAVILQQGRVKADLILDDLRCEGSNLKEALAQISGYTGNKYRSVLDEA